ncbi:MAG TPA: mannosyltransferase family protein [Pyrinomonadaceae bacterium]
MLARLRKPLYKAWFVRFRQDRSVREALFVFLLTRTLIFFILICAGQLTVSTYPDINAHDAFISFDRPQIARKLRETMWHADVAHYIGLSKAGYLHAPLDVNDPHSQQFAFFPLHPLLLWLLGHVTTDVILWGAALCNFFFFLALVFLHKLTLAFGYDEPVARRTLFYLAAFPASYFFSIPMTESLFVLLTVASFYAAKREHWWVAGVIGLFASATRVTGVLLLPALFVLSWQMYRSLQLRKILGLLLIPFGLFAYMFYSWWLSGDALAFKHAAAAWGHKPSIFFLNSVVKWLIDPHVIAQPWNVHLFNVGSVLLCFVCIYLLVRRREWALAVYTLMSILVPLSSGVLQSLERYTMGFFPVFIALGIAAKSEHSDQAIRFVFVFLLGIMTALYAAAYTNALT